ncbi:MarR family winged helix-turn-helix transcriptional regulator [Aestuariirhabdus sp. Z084]|uniref:MarR family winged helix-turn-helix transcriptional regulator n=1 Tax=Aestuariirhabdus haliotis TaxID=2918751 RepID=UPI00201B3F0D|nr:MarR family winged helix-turn-helix transcriptional regulator [Aestuariirhabdus haliotis]MCL6417349.1 MarR family winged helix-turn-helix transcriptional regulator [Aestuariirhabdus haliotis]MCL6421294.1 MarR family winged helix-turn-helix transcriptional regulator [Aestuariirhabdus haliotis]
MDKRLFFLLSQAQHRLFRFADRHCDRHLDISVTQAAALMFISKQEGCLQKDVAAALNLNNSAITGLVARMRRNGLIARRPCDEDGRASRLFLCKQGSDKLPLLLPMIDQFNQALTDGFSDDEIRIVIRFLNKIMMDFS